MDIGEVLLKENVCLSLQAKTKREAITEMIDMLFCNGIIEDKGVFEEEIYKREGEGVTGIGDGIAIPHGRSATVRKSVIAIGRTSSDLDWETCDDQPVRCIIMFAIRDVDMSQHILLLSHVAELLLDREVIEMLHTTNDVEKIISVFRRGMN